MLFPLDTNTPKCKVFEKLNAELLFFLHKSIVAKKFTKSLFSKTTGKECWENEATKEKFKAVFKALPINEVDRKNLFNLINNNQNVHLLFSNKTAVIPKIQPLNLFSAMKSLTTHLFTRTKKLTEIVKLATESIDQHYQKYIRSNSELCFLCGTAALSHNRFNVADDEQWTSDYDHLLCKDKYPAFSCHPGNFVPTCHICNSKAKGAKDVLFEGNTRRKAFYPLPPLTQSFYQKVRVKPVFAELADFAAGGDSNPLRAVQVKYANPTADEREMIKAWVDIYQVPKRVGERIVSNFCEVVASDCRPLDFQDFHGQLARQALTPPMDMKTTEWRFWWYRLYQWLHAQGDDVKRDAWALIEWKQQQVNNNNDAEDTFGV
jgi:hypothetical protein